MSRVFSSAILALYSASIADENHNRQAIF